MSYARVALISLLLPLIGLATTATFNRIIDPYRIFSGSVIRGQSADYADYPRVHPNLRLHKRWQVRHRKPDTLVLGTSKAIQGIPMGDAFFADADAYNLGVPLASMQEIDALLNHALAQGPVRRAVLMLDFLSFNVLARSDGPAAGFTSDSLDRPGRSAPDRAADLVAALLSLDALRASVATLRADPHGGHRVLNARGGRDDGDMLARLADGGHRDNAIAIERFFMDTVYLPPPARAFLMEVGPGSRTGRATRDEPTSAFDPFERLLRTAHERQIELHIVISPSHSRLAELLSLAGLAPMLERWKRRLTTINERLAAQAGTVAFALSDASLPNATTTEPFPPEGDTTTRMRGYYESVHFNQAVGARILQGLADARLQIGEDLRSDSVDDTLERAHERLRRFAADYPQDVIELQRIVEQVVHPR